jgi:hypothetical protein
VPSETVFQKQAILKDWQCAFLKGIHMKMCAGLSLLTTSSAQWSFL